MYREFTEKEELSRDTYLASVYEKYSKRLGDHWFRMANAITGAADFTEADWGEAPQGAIDRYQ